MNELFSLQNKFQEHLLNAENEIVNDIVETENVSTDVRLSIYSYAYRSRLLEALAANFPVLQIYLGDEQFETLGHAYMDLHPSHYRSIRWFGDKLENFLTENTPYNDYSYLSEMARVEWLMTLVFDAADSDIVTLETLRNISPEAWVDMRLIAHPSVHLSQLSWNTMSIWEAISEEKSPGELLQGEAPVTWIFWRKNLANHHCSLMNDEACAMDAMLKGSTFGEICEALCHWVDEKEVAMRAASLLQGWISTGLIAKIKY